MPLESPTEPSPGTFHYAGGELELFAQAANWKSYFARQIRPYVRGDVLEVGAGMGATALALRSEAVKRWVSLEPDPQLFEILRKTLAPSKESKTELYSQMVKDLPKHSLYDSILYVDVLEHIDNDREELHEAALRLRKGGFLIIVAPAHQWLYSNFDRAIGHFRRYSAETLLKVVPGHLKSQQLRYLDSAGLFASLSNRLWLRASQPTLFQIQLWDRILVPASRVLDPLLGYRVGKSLMGVWTSDSNK